MPINRADYPPDWDFISRRAKVRAGWQCEFVYDNGERCAATDWAPHPHTGRPVPLQTCHLNHTPSDNRPENLAVYCPRHHDLHDAAHRRETQRLREQAEAQAALDAAGAEQLGLGI